MQFIQLAIVGAQISVCDTYSYSAVTVTGAHISAHCHKSVTSIYFYVLIPCLYCYIKYTMTVIKDKFPEENGYILPKYIVTVTMRVQWVLEKKEWICGFATGGQQEPRSDH